MGFFYFVPFHQPSTPTRFPLITATGMCHFLPVHHLGMGSLVGSKVKIQHLPCRLGLQNTPAASLQRGKTPVTNVLVYDTKKFNGEVPVILELWGMQSTPPLPSLLGPLLLGLVAPDRVLSMG